MSRPTPSPVRAPDRAPGHRRRAGDRSEDGLSLVEMVVAIGIIMVVLTSALSVFVIAKKAQQTAEGTDQASQLAYEEIERIRQLDWTDIGFRETLYNDVIQGSTTTEFSTSLADYNTKATIASGETQVRFTTAAMGSPDVRPYKVVTTHNNTFRVYTAITFGRNPALGLPTSAATTGAYQYSFKRVTVTVHWKASGNGAPYRVAAESWFAPEAEDAIPPGVPCLIEETQAAC